MSYYGQSGSEEGSDDEIGFPKTPGGLLNANHSDNDSDQNKASKRSNAESSSGSDNSGSEASDDEETKQVKPPPASDSNSDSEENEPPKARQQSSSDEESSSDNEPSHEMQKDNRQNDSDEDSDEPVNRSSKKAVVFSGSENEAPNLSDSDNDSASPVASKKRSSRSSASSSEEEVAKRSKKKKRIAKAQSSSSSAQASEASSSDEENINEKTKKTAQDLFGEMSDEEDDRVEKSPSAPNEDDKNVGEEEEDGEAVADAINAIFGDDDDDEFGQPSGKQTTRMNDDFEDFDDEGGEREDGEGETMPETKIEVEIPRIVADLGNQIHFVKLPNFLSVDTHPYDPAWYEDEGEEDDIHDDEGRARLKLKVENTIRWRTVVDDDGETYRESNARVVKWSDGTMSLYLGDEIFDIQTFNLRPGENNHLYVRQGTGLQGQSVFRTKIQFRPFSTESGTHRKLTLSLADRSQKTQKICVLPSVGKDPEARRSEMIKKEEDKLKASIRKESQHKRVSKSGNSRSTLSNLFDDDDDDENISIAKIKNQFKKGSTRYGSYKDDKDTSDEDEDEEDEDSEDEDKHDDGGGKRKASDDEDSDEDIFENKKKKMADKKIVESDDDEDD